MLVLLIGALVVVLVAEGTVRLAAPYLQEPLVYGDDATQVKVAQLDRLGPACVDLVVAGDSTARDAFDASAFTAVDPARRRAYNAALDGASPVLLERWLTEEVVPRVHPSTVVVTLASLDFNAHGNATTSAIAAYDDAPLTLPGLGGRVESFLSAHSALVRYRTELRDPAALADAFGAWRAGAETTRRSADGIPGLLGPDGQGESRRQLHYLHDVATKSFTRDQLLAGFTIDDAQVRAAHDLVTDLQRSGVHVVLAILPVTADYISLHPHGAADFDAFLAVSRSIASDTGAPLIDLHDQGGDEKRFADTHHLNAAGQAWFSAALPDQLAASGVATTRRCP